MTFLPIVARELRVAARRRITFWLRVIAALVGLVVGIGFLLLSNVRGMGNAMMGGNLFAVLTWLSVAAALSAGLFFTSDCLSEEKREGTLGFLFLTDLRGYDVVAGKLLATSLRSLYALLALFPILAVTLLMGGVTGVQFWKTALALLNALVCSLAAGLFVSAISRDSQKALAATLLLLLALTLGGPLLDLILASMKGRSFKPVFSLSSPGFVFSAASRWGRSPYWLGFLLTQLLGWLLFAAACILVRRTWQERSSTVSGTSGNWTHSWKYGGAGRRGRLRRKLIDRNPVLWLACRERWQSLAIWTMAIFVVIGFTPLVIKLPSQVWMAWNYLGGFLMLLVYLWTASQACRFFVEGRRSGITELLLVSPLDEKQIVRGQWRALWRMFGLPVILLLTVQLIAATLSQLSWRQIMSQANAASTAGTTGTNVVSSTNVVVFSAAIGTNSYASLAQAAKMAGPELMMAVIPAMLATISTAANLVALCWFGMWMGMTSKTANLATLKTLLFVQIIPWFIINFGSTMVISTLMIPLLLKGNKNAPGAWLSWWPFLSAALAAVLSLAKDLGFITWSRKKLYSSFREQAAQIPGQPRFVTPPILPQAIRIPPVIPAQ